MDKTHVLIYMHAGFADLLREFVSIEQSCYWVSIERVNIKSAMTMTAAMNPCSTAILVGKSILQILHWKHQYFNRAFSQESFTSKWWLSFNV